MIEDRGLTRDDLPFPLDRPLTGQDLLQVFPAVLQPLWSQAAQAARGDAAQVTAVNPGPPKTVTLSLDGGDSVNVRYLASYTPAVGDIAVVLWNATRRVVIGKLA